MVLVKLKNYPNRIAIILLNLYVDVIAPFYIFLRIVLKYRNPKSVLKIMTSHPLPILLLSLT